MSFVSRRIESALKWLLLSVSSFEVPATNVYPKLFSVTGFSFFVVLNICRWVLGFSFSVSQDHLVLDPEPIHYSWQFSIYLPTYNFPSWNSVNCKWIVSRNSKLHVIICCLIREKYFRKKRLKYEHIVCFVFYSFNEFSTYFWEKT